MCRYCDYSDDNCVIFQDGLTGDWYLSIRTDEWDNYDDDFVYLREYINYCPWCGRSLYEESQQKNSFA